MERATGFEPATSTLGRWHSTAELRPRVYVDEPLLVQSAFVVFKQNLPIPALIFALLVVGGAVAVIFHTPPEEDLLRQAIDKYVAKLGPVSQLEIHGTVADIITQDKGRLIYAEFEKKDGAWTYARNLAEEFSEAMKSPETQKTVLSHLGERVSQRLKMAVSFKEGLSFDYKLGRDSEGTLVGQCDVSFAYPKVADQQRFGKYSDYFEWKNGRWQSFGPGDLFDAIGPPK
jgi:hypothetical protein